MTAKEFILNKIENNWTMEFADINADNIDELAKAFDEYAEAFDEYAEAKFNNVVLTNAVRDKSDGCPNCGKHEYHTHRNKQNNNQIRKCIWCKIIWETIL